jgi:hypothetical protein
LIDNEAPSSSSSSSSSSSTAYLRRDNHTARRAKKRAKKSLKASIVSFFREFPLAATALLFTTVFVLLRQSHLLVMFLLPLIIYFMLSP